MALDITKTLADLIDLTGVIGGVVDASAATDPLTVEAGVTLDGALSSVLGGVLGQVLGDGVRATVQGATVVDLGTVEGMGPGGIGIDLRLGGIVTVGTGAVASGTMAGIDIAGTAAGLTSAVNNIGAVSAAGQGGIGVTLDLGALNNGGTVASTGVGGIGATIGTGTVQNAAASSIGGALDGLDVLGSAAVTNAGRIIGTAGEGVRLAAGALTNAPGGAISGGLAGVAMTGGNLANAAGGSIAGVVDGVLNSGAGTLDNAGTVLATAGDGISTAAGTLTNEATGTITGAINGIVGTGTAAITNDGAVVGQAASGVALAGGNLTNAATGAITGTVDGVLMAASSGGGTVDNLGTISASGAGGIGVNLLGGGVVIDSGTISGTDGGGNAGGVAVNLGGTGGSRLVLDPGAVLNGIAQAAGTGNTLEIAAGSGITALKDIGTTITGFASTVLDGGAVADVAGAVTTPGTVTVGDGASLTLDGPVAKGVTIALGGAGATLQLGDVADFQGTIDGLTSSATLGLAGLGAGTTVSYAPGTGLTVTSPTGATSVIPITLPAGVSLGLTPGGSGVTVGAGGTGTTVTVGGTTAGGGSTMGGGTTTGGGGTSGGTTAGGIGAGSTVVAADPAGGGTTVTTTSPLGSVTTETLPPGSTLAQGSGQAAGDVVSIDPYADFAGRGRFAVSGHVAAASGVQSVTISAVIDGGGSQVLGTATVAVDGSYTFLDTVGAHLQGFITATETDGLGASTSVQSPYSLQAGLRGDGHVAEQDLYTPDGDAEVALTAFKRDDSRKVDVMAGGQTFKSDFFDTFDDHGAPANTFVFSQNHGRDVITQFRADGADHDTISLPSADFADLAAVIGNTHSVAGGSLIVDPNTGDTIKLTGVSKAELKANPSDFSFHG